MGQQFVEVTSVRYGGRSVISERSLNGCSLWYRLSMASEGSRTVCKQGNKTNSNLFGIVGMLAVFDAPLCGSAFSM